MGIKNEYFSFLLRLFRLGDPQSGAWRASIEDPHSRQVIEFDNLPALYAYLIQLISPAGNAQDPPDKGESQTH
jgi:hypothetical protein